MDVVVAATDDVTEDALLQRTALGMLQAPS
jgi:hypothetical protein